MNECDEVRQRKDSFEDDSKKNRRRSELQHLPLGGRGWPSRREQSLRRGRSGLLSRPYPGELERFFSLYLDRRWVLGCMVPSGVRLWRSKSLDVLEGELESHFLGTLWVRGSGRKGPAGARRLGRRRQGVF